MGFMRVPPFVVWNLFLAAVPLVLSIVLFRWSRRRTVLWWCGVAGFLAFLPNAPYVLSDAVHLVPRLRAESSWADAVVLLAGAAVFFLAGLEAYALCIANLRHYLGRVIVPLELAIHAAVAVGIYLGRVLRFNSWDLLGNAHLVVDGARDALSRPWPLALVVFTFCVTAVACEALLRVNLLAARAARWRPAR
ncbi:MAG: DUF1361 domain-containing protein [Acidimicrobiales bacterium]